MAKKNKNKFDPEGAGYDHETAKEFGLVPDALGNMPAVFFETGMILYGKLNHRFKRIVALEEYKGNKIVKKKKRYYSEEK